MTEMEPNLTSPRERAQEQLITDVTQVIIEVMDRDKVTRSELARRVGKSPPYITQVLNGERNMTLRTIADLTFALGCDLKFVEVDGEDHDV